MAEGGRNTETGLGKSNWSCTKPVTTRPTVGILPPLSNATKTGTVTGGWALLEPGLLVLDEDCVTALLPASPFRLLILLYCYAGDPGCCSGPEVLQRLLSSLPQAIGALNS